MSGLVVSLLYLVIGFLWFLGFVLVDRKFNLELFIEGGSDRSANGLGVALILAWVFVVPLALIIGLVYGLHRLCSFFLTYNDEDKSSDIAGFLKRKGYEEKDVLEALKELDGK
jgi:hypothetical protein